MDKKLLFTPIIVGLISPSLVIFYLQVFVGGYSVSASLSDILSRQFAEGENLFLLAVIGLVPFVLLSAILFVYKKKHKISEVYLLMTFGLVGILVLMLPSHYSVWYPLYGPGRMSSTAVVGFLFIPIYCVLSMLVGLLVGVGIIKIKEIIDN